MKYQAFYKDIATLCGVNNLDGVFFAYMASLADPVTMRVDLSSELKREIMEETESKAKNISNTADQSIKRLKQKGLIKSIGVGSYIVQVKIKGLKAAREELAKGRRVTICATYNKIKRVKLEII